MEWSSPCRDCVAQGRARVNTAVMRLFQAGRAQLEAGNCSLNPLKQEIVELMTVPLVQVRQAATGPGCTVQSRERCGTPTGWAGAAAPTRRRRRQQPSSGRYCSRPHSQLNCFSCADPAPGGRVQSCSGGTADQAAVAAGRESEQRGRLAGGPDRAGVHLPLPGHLLSHGGLCPAADWAILHATGAGGRPCGRGWQILLGLPAVRGRGGRPAHFSRPSSLTPTFCQYLDFQRSKNFYDKLYFFYDFGILM